MRIAEGHCEGIRCPAGSVPEGTLEKLSSCSCYFSIEKSVVSRTSPGSMKLEASNVSSRRAGGISKNDFAEDLGFRVLLDIHNIHTYIYIYIHIY